MSDLEVAKYALRTSQYQASFMIDICDLTLIGTQLEENGLVINLTKEYYQQEIIERPRAREILIKCGIASLVGNEIVKQAIGMGLANTASIRRISCVPFLMIYKFSR